MGSVHKEIVQGRKHDNIAVALESLRYYSTEYLFLKVHLTFSHDNADEYSFIHDALLCVLLCD